jgi:hypothetical protein
VFQYLKKLRGSCQYPATATVQPLLTHSGGDGDGDGNGDSDAIAIAAAVADAAASDVRG